MTPERYFLLITNANPDRLRFHCLPMISIMGEVKPMIHEFVEAKPIKV
jgi:hypothetical protein